jgi:hypothetical protein
MQDVTFAFANGAEPLLTIVPAGVLPDHDTTYEDSSPVVEA